MVDTDRPAEIIELAERHGLRLEQDSLRVTEAGLDFRVVFATAADGTDWILRIPRRDDVADGIDAEARILDLVGSRLDTAVPEWRIRTRDLIAYPALPGEPGLTLDSAGEPVWHFDVEDPRYAKSLGTLIGRLHSIERSAAKAAGAPIQTPDEVRTEWSTRLNQVAGEFTIAAGLRRQWDSWLDDDDLWPDTTVFTHGELYPAHLLLDPQTRVVGVLDWTTAKVSDPAVDFMYHAMIAEHDAFQIAVNAYEAVTGSVPSNLQERCAAIVAAGPLNYAAYALTTGDASHAETAASQLNPE